ncbi:conserved hypothetical protein [Sphingomonas sp. AX6]|nr:conserved hypothetical protein [Sphingomonas sp. AX6]
MSEGCIAKTSRVPTRQSRVVGRGLGPAVRAVAETQISAANSLPPLERVKRFEPRA